MKKIPHTKELLLEKGKKHQGNIVLIARELEVKRDYILELCEKFGIETQYNVFWRLNFEKDPDYVEELMKKEERKKLELKKRKEKRKEIIERSGLLKKQRILLENLDYLSRKYYLKYKDSEKTCKKVAFLCNTTQDKVKDSIIRQKLDKSVDVYSLMEKYGGNFRLMYRKTGSINIRSLLKEHPLDKYPFKELLWLYDTCKGDLLEISKILEVSLAKTAITYRFMGEPIYLEVNLKSFHDEFYGNYHIIAAQLEDRFTKVRSLFKKNGFRSKKFGKVAFNSYAKKCKNDVKKLMSEFPIFTEEEIIEKIEEQRLEEEKLYALYEKHEGCLSYIAQELKLTRERVRQIYLPLGLKGKGTKKVTDRYSDAQLLEIYEKHKGCISRIAKEIGISSHSVSESYKKRLSLGAQPKYTDEYLLMLYKKYHGNLNQVANHMGLYSNGVYSLYKRRLNLRGINGGSYSDEELLKLHEKFEGNLLAIANALKILKKSTSILYARRLNMCVKNNFLVKNI